MGDEEAGKPIGIDQVIHGMAGDVGYIKGKVDTMSTQLADDRKDIGEAFKIINSLREEHAATCPALKKDVEELKTRMKTQEDAARTEEVEKKAKKKIFEWLWGMISSKPKIAFGVFLIFLAVALMTGMEKDQISKVLVSIIQKFIIGG
jgi:hypothetical protein